MKHEETSLIVPWDFTHVSEFAIEHAIKIAKPLDKSIQIVHIVDPKAPDAEKNVKQQNLDKQASRFSQQFELTVESVIKEGNIYTTISEYADEVNANIIIMGTHGVVGMQKLLGSKALKVIEGSKVPYIVVQDRPRDINKFGDIVFPIDFRTENREKLSWAIYLGKYFNTRVHIFKPPEKDSGLAKKVNMNLNFAVKHLIQNNIDYEIRTSDKKGNFEDETIAFAQEIEADMIIVMTTKNVNLADYVLGVSEQKLIANTAKIPIMCVNPRSHVIDLVM